MPGFVGALESEAGRGFVGVRGLVPEVGRREVIGVPGLVGVLGFVSALEPEAGRGFAGAPGFLGAPEPEAGRGDVIGVPGPSRKKLRIKIQPKRKQIQQESKNKLNKRARGL